MKNILISVFRFHNCLLHRNVRNSSLTFALLLTSTNMKFLLIRKNQNKLNLNWIEKLLFASCRASLELLKYIKIIKIGQDYHIQMLLRVYNYVSESYSLTLTFWRILVFDLITHWETPAFVSQCKHSIFAPISRVFGHTPSSVESYIVLHYRKGSFDV